MTGEIFRTELDPANSPADTMGSLVARIFGTGLQESDFVLYNVTQRFEYDPNEKFGNKTMENDLLLLMNSFDVPGGAG